MCPPIQKPRLKVTHNKGDGPTVADREHEKAKAIEYSFPLDGAGWLARYVVDDAIDALHLIDDAGSDAA